MNYIVYLITVVCFFKYQPTVAQPAKLIRGPYLQVVSPTSITIRWRTDQPNTGRVWFGSSVDSWTGDQQESKPTLEHIVTLSGLQPATRYAYAIGYDNTLLAAGPDYFVKTAVPAGDTRPLRFWVLGDFGSGTDNQKNVYQAYRNATATRPADLWVWLGDNAYSYGLEDEYQQYVFSVYGPTLRNTPIFTTPGNHDYAQSETNFTIPYYNLFSFPQQGESGGVPSGSTSYYSADYGNVHLVSLDSQGRQEGQYRLYDTTTAQVQWLKRDLAANTLPWTIVIFHHPPYSKGGHNSDTELAMKLIRENLTPILERYGVDLVLSGHSHGYERTYRLKGLRGLANTFDKTKHIAENTTARYDGSPNSCPILTKGQGTVYIVNGSGGQLGGQSPGYPHPATVFNNTTLGGSMVLDVNDNRLDAQLIMADGSVQDRFTIMKQVNKISSLTAEYADTLQLKASWPAMATSSAASDYRWSDGQTNRTSRFVADKAGTMVLTVADNQQCLTDQFTVTVQPPPRVVAQTSTSICAGSSLTVTATTENTTKAAGWQYDVLLSDAVGNFTTEQIIGSGSLTELKATVPPGLPAGTGYRLQVRPRGIPYAQLIPSDGIEIKPLPTATLTGSTTVLIGNPVSLTLNFTGEGPWQGSLSDGTTFSGSTNPMMLTVQPTQSGLYSITSVENGCGKGTASGQASITVQLLTAEEEFADGRLRIYPNPARSTVQLELTLTQKKEVNVALHDLQGRLVFRQQFGSLTSLAKALPMPDAAGVYVLTIGVGETTLTRKVVRE